MKSKKLTAEEINAKIKDLIECLAVTENEVWLDINDNHLQHILSSLIKVYAAKVELSAGSLEPINSGLENHQPSDTEVMLFVSKLLQVKKIDLFEVQMFRSFCFS